MIGRSPPIEKVQEAVRGKELKALLTYERDLFLQSPDIAEFPILADGHSRHIGRFDGGEQPVRKLVFGDIFEAATCAPSTAQPESHSLDKIGIFCRRGSGPPHRANDRIHQFLAAGRA
jgi:hypothetical protein